MRAELAALTAALVLLVPAAARAEDSYVTLTTDDTSIPGGRSFLYTPADSTITMHSGTSGSGMDAVYVDVQRGTASDNWSFGFVSADGSPLHTGVYDDVGPSGEGRPGFHLSGQGASCEPDAGRFEIKDIAAGADGNVARFWAIYEYHCGMNPLAKFGEIKVNEPTPGAAAEAVPSIARWSAADFGYARATMPVTVRALGALHVASATIDGPAAGDYAIANDGCTGTQLGAGGTCQVSVALTPQAPGTRLATLHVRGDAGQALDVPLQSYTYGGTTRFVFHGGPAGDGQTDTYTPANALMTIDGANTMVHLRESSADNAYWDATFAPGQGDALHPGTYDNAARYPYNDSHPGMSVDGHGSGCNTYSGHFTVREATYNRHNEVQTFAVDFVEDCDGSTAHELTGSLDFRSGDTTVRPPWMGGPPIADGSPAAAGASGTPAAGAPGSTSTSPASSSTRAVSLTRRLRAGLIAGRRLTFTLPAGRLRVSWRDAHGRVLARAVRTWRRLGRQTVVLRLTRAGRRELRGHHHRRVRLTATFRPAAPHARAVSVTRLLSAR